MKSGFNNERIGLMMKAMLMAVLAMAAVGSATFVAQADDAKKGASVAEQKAPVASAEFERMKGLVGSWKGNVDIGQGPVEMLAQYRLLAGGTVLEERVFPGTPNEMVTMYFDRAGKLALTHYCLFGNRPGMVLKSSDDKTIRFAFDEKCGIDVKKESHMHALTMRFDDANTITTSCSAFMDGKEMPEHPTTLKRVSN